MSRAICCHTSQLPMSLVQACLFGAFSLALCKALDLLVLRRSHGIDLDGPKKGNWLIGSSYPCCHLTTAPDLHTGNITDLFEGGVDYCVRIAEKYGGAVRLHGPDGVSISTFASLNALATTVPRFRNQYMCPTHSHYTTSLSKTSTSLKSSTSSSSQLSSYFLILH